jgi:prepilin-type N-terminal cleavage/methylation domain-containing protein
MRRDRQRGMTLIELLVAMAVTSILLVGLGAVLFNVPRTYQGWIDRMNGASTGAELAASIQADSHRYVVCGSPGDQAQTLNLCPPDRLDPTHPAVRYTITTSAPYVVSRQPAGQSATFMGRSDGTQLPRFWVDCFDDGNGVSGHIHLYNLRLRSDSGDGGMGGAVDSENYSVYYVAPWRPGCQP